MNFLLSLKIIATKEKPALLFLLKLLILGCVLKCIFFFYNYNISNGWSIHKPTDIWPILKWSLLYDFFSISLINAPLLFFVFITGKYLHKKIISNTLCLFFAILNSTAILLNSIDIFYFRFHRQRADADLFYVLRNPFENGTITVYLIILTIILFGVVTFWLTSKSIAAILKIAATGNSFKLTNSIFILFLILFFLTGNKKQLPAYPLTQLDAVQLPLVQNSFHSFIYSLYRRNETAIPDNNYLALDLKESLFSIHKKNNTIDSPKNVVLFIMESVPLEFFDSSSSYKVKMPFLDNLVTKSTFFRNAFSYSYNSNKGITAILAGIPTITDIPLYHSNFTSINRTSIGKALAKNNYSSAFFIGDNYDDFGFAKCCKWLGIQQYYCMKDIPNNRDMEKHSMGLHDEYVLNFMQNKLGETTEPFFAVQYNISTHYPNDIPKTFKEKYPTTNISAPMKTMQYYNDCLEKFFIDAATKPWYKNTVFIFCSDHWAQPNYENIKIDEVESFRIPLFIYDPSIKKGKTISERVSQLDILNTVLYYGNIHDTIISYGENLQDLNLYKNRTVFTKINNAVYQAINNDYVLGFNAIEGKAIYCYEYKKDIPRKNNLLLQHYSPAIDSIILETKAFLQTATNHYKMKRNL